MAASSSRSPIPPSPLPATRHNERAVAAQGNITFIRPGKLGDVLVATAREISRSGRSGIYDVRVTAGDDGDRRISRSFPHHRRHVAAGARDNAANKNRHVEGNARWLRQDLKSSGSGYSAELDDAERASRDEIMALQTKRLAWSLKHAYDNVAHYKKAFDAAGVHPSDFRQLLRSRQIPVHGEDGSARQLSLQHVRGAARKAGPRPRVLGHDGQADRGRLHPRPISTSGRT